jgi:hypothetical protein
VSHDDRSTQEDGEGGPSRSAAPEEEAHDVSQAQANSSPPQQPSTQSEAPGSRMACLPCGLPVIDSPLGLKSLTCSWLVEHFWLLAQARTSSKAPLRWPLSGPAMQAILAIRAVGYESQAELLIIIMLMRLLLCGLAGWKRLSVIQYCTVNSTAAALLLMLMLP